MPVRFVVIEYIRGFSLTKDRSLTHTLFNMEVIGISVSANLLLQQFLLLSYTMCYEEKYTSKSNDAPCHSILATSRLAKLFLNSVCHGKKLVIVNYVFVLFVTSRIRSPLPPPTTPGLR